MPYKKTSDLPERVRENLPIHAERIYREAYNNAYKQYDKPDERQMGRSREATAHAVAWAAVKKKYKKDKSTGDWKRK